MGEIEGLLLERNIPIAPPTGRLVKVAKSINEHAKKKPRRREGGASHQLEKRRAGRRRGTLPQPPPRPAMPAREAAVRQREVVSR
jgi:hypothetical protein